MLLSRGFPSSAADIAESPGPMVRVFGAAPLDDDRRACHMFLKSSTPATWRKPATSGYDLRVPWMFLLWGKAKIHGKT